jgi:crossover junction endodeoxyribonuclease RusA
MRYWTSSHFPAYGPVCITLVYLYDEAALDVDNIIKPIQDALVGLAFPDDSMVTDVIGRRRHLGGTFDLSRASPVLIEGFEYGDEFVYVHIADAPPQEQLL